MSDSLKGAPRPASESAAEAVARYCREHGIPLPRRHEYLPRWHPNIQAYLRNKWEHNAPGVWACYCATCEKRFYARHPAGYCSPACTDAARHERERERRMRAKAGRTCAHCGAPLSTVARADSRYCSPACRQAAYRGRQVSGCPQLTSRNAP